MRFVGVCGGPYVLVIKETPKRINIHKATGRNVPLWFHMKLRKRGQRGQ